MKQWQLFAEGGAAAGSAASGANGAGSPAAQGEGAATPTAAVAAPGMVQDTGKEFTDFMRTHKDQADAWFQERFDKRHREAKGNEERLKALDPVLRMLGDKYGWKADGNINDLVKAIQDDDSYYEEESLQTGIPIEQLKKNRQLEDQLRSTQAERDELQARIDQDQQAIQKQQALARLQQEEQVVKGVYPDFDLRAELEDANFQRMVRAGVDLRAAYEVVHKDDIFGRGLAYTANRVAQQVANSVAANQRRPRENGAGGQASGTVHTDVNSMSKADFEQLKVRARRGEKITL